METSYYIQSLYLGDRTSRKEARGRREVMRLQPLPSSAGYPQPWASHSPSWGVIRVGVSSESLEENRSYTEVCSKERAIGDGRASKPSGTIQ